MQITTRLRQNHILAVSIGLVYLWFGMLKFFPDQSPAEDLAKSTIDLITFHLIPSKASILLLAIWEVGIGILLLLNVYRKPVVIIALIHMIFTFVPLFAFSELSFAHLPYGFTLLGQYIFKNVIIIAALITIYKMPVQNHR